jgi:hypothetical protein
MNVVGSGNVVQYFNTVSLAGLEQPGGPAPLIPTKLQKKVPLMTPMRQVPYMIND